MARIGALRSRRRFLRCGLALAGVGLATGCGMLPPAPGPPKVRRIGILRPVSAENPYTDSIRQGLRELGYVEGQNLQVEYRFSAGDYDRLPDLAAELVGLGVEVIVADGPASQAARRVTETVPIVLSLSVDPVETGLAASLARPGGNVTGLSLFQPQLVGKRLELLREVATGATRIAVLQNPTVDGAAALTREMEAAARVAGVQVQWLRVEDPAGIPPAFGALAAGRAEGLLVFDDAMFFDQRARLAELAAASRLPAMFSNRGFAEAGGLLAYGPSLHDMFRRSATFVDKILQGANPAELPIEQPTVFDYVINLRTARAVGVTIPQAVLGQATELIQ